MKNKKLIDKVMVEPTWTECKGCGKSWSDIAIKDGNGLCPECIKIKNEPEINKRKDEYGGD